MSMSETPGHSATTTRPDPLGAIRQRFLALADSYSVEIEILMEDAADPAQTAEALGEVGAIAHRVAGVAATLGFERLGDLAARLDRQLTEARRQGVLSVDSHDGLIREFHAAMEDLLERGHR